LPLTLLTGCQVTYIVKSAYSQAELLRQRVPLDQALQDPKLSDEQKRKLSLAKEAREFAEKGLGLKPTLNYTSYVHLNRPYVTYVVSAAKKNELTPYNWSYPVLGSLPYKGFFDPAEAAAEAQKLAAQGLDTYVRGVSAYSTLGWFRDPILSSMLNYKDYVLVNTIIHETVHATIYVRSEADFNERLATFFGNKGAEAFYLHKEGLNGQTLQAMIDDNHDDKLFSSFLTRELRLLGEWYEERKTVAIDEETRSIRMRDIQKRFTAEVRPLIRNANSYKSFETEELNNARLLTYRLYYENLDDFEAVFSKLGGDFHKMLDFCKNLEKSKDPKTDLGHAAREL
jgi:predicted aminopeptidase